MCSKKNNLDGTKDEDWLIASLKSARKLLDSLPPEIRKAVENDAQFREARLRIEREAIGDDS